MSGSLEKYGFIPYHQVLENKSTTPKLLSDYGFIPYESYQPQNISDKTAPQQEFISDEQIDRDIERKGGQFISRGLEAVVGLPGDIGNLIGNIFGKEFNFPGSQQLRNLSEKATAGYTTPQSPLEEKVGELTQDIALMALPGAKGYSLARNIGIPLVANLTKEGIAFAGGEETGQAAGKIGTMVALDLITGNKGGLKKHMGDLFRKAEESIPKGLSIDANKLNKSLIDLEKNLTAGGNRPSSKKALEKLKEIQGEIKNGKIDAKRLAAYRPAINEAIEELGGFQLEVPRKLKPAAIRNLNQVKSETIKTLEDYGKKFNPQYSEFSKNANEAWAAYENSNKITSIIKNKIKYSPKSKAALALFHLAPLAASGIGSLAIPQLGVTGLGLTGLYQGLKVLNRMKNSPTIRKYYTNVIKSAAAGNIPAATKNLKALDESLGKIDFDFEE